MADARERSDMREKFTCECCGQEYETAAASVCCAPDENTLHVRRDACANLTVCGLPVAEVNWEFEREFIAYERSDGIRLESLLPRMHRGEQRIRSQPDRAGRKNDGRNDRRED